MSITIELQAQHSVRLPDMLDGHAYMSPNGVIYVGNKYTIKDPLSNFEDTIVAFSLNGNMVLLLSHDADHMLFTEVNLNVKVTSV